jgi:hypothetical protein
MPNHDFSNLLLFKNATVVPHPASNVALFCTEMHNCDGQKTLYCTMFLRIAPTCTDLQGGLIIVMSAVQVRLSPPQYKREGRKFQKLRPFVLAQKPQSATTVPKLRSISYWTSS